MDGMKVEILQITVGELKSIEKAAAPVRGGGKGGSGSAGEAGEAKPRDKLFQGVKNDKLIVLANGDSKKKSFAIFEKIDSKKKKQLLQIVLDDIATEKIAIEILIKVTTSLDNGEVTIEDLRSKRDEMVQKIKDGPATAGQDTPSGKSPPAKKQKLDKTRIEPNACKDSPATGPVGPGGAPAQHKDFSSLT